MSSILINGTNIEDLQRVLLAFNGHEIIELPDHGDLVDRDEFIGKPLPQEYLNKEIKSVSGSGGWSRSDFLFVVERSEE